MFQIKTNRSNRLCFFDIHLKKSERNIESKMSSHFRKTFILNFRMIEMHFQSQTFSNKN